LKETGIFRLSGSTAEMNELKDCFNRGEIPDLSKYSVHSIAGVLKLFFRQLPEPLFTFELFDPFMKTIGKARDRYLANLDIELNKEAKQERVSTLLKQLPRINYVLLSKLIPLLANVCKYSDENKMTSSNLGIVFGPTLFWQKEVNIMNEMMGNTNTNDAVAFLIDECDVLFKVRIQMRLD
jgi:breakpoint cluster region protein